MRRLFSLAASAMLLFGAAPLPVPATTADVQSTQAAEIANLRAHVKHVFAIYQENRFGRRRSLARLINKSDGRRMDLFVSTEEFGLLAPPSRTVRWAIAASSS